MLSGCNIIVGSIQSLMQGSNVNYGSSWDCVNNNDFSKNIGLPIPFVQQIQQSEATKLFLEIKKMNQNIP